MKVNVPRLSTVASKAAFQSATVAGLLVPWICCASQSLGTIAGNSQHSFPIT